MAYNKTDLDSTLNEAAARVAGATKTKFVYATAHGYTIANMKPPHAQDYYAVDHLGVAACPANRTEYEDFSYVVEYARPGAPYESAMMGGEDTLAKALAKVTHSVFYYLSIGCIVYLARIDRVCKRCHQQGTLRVGHKDVTCPSCKGAPVFETMKTLVELPFEADVNPLIKAQEAQ